jgi:hypothetical protein
LFRTDCTLNRTVRVSIFDASIGVLFVPREPQKTPSVPAVVHFGLTGRFEYSTRILNPVFRKLGFKPLYGADPAELNRDSKEVSLGESLAR